MVTASEDKTAKIWNAETGKDLLTLQGHEDYLLSAAFSTDGQRVTTASLDGVEKLWEAVDWSLTKEAFDELKRRRYQDRLTAYAAKPE